LLSVLIISSGLIFIAIVCQSLLLYLPRSIVLKEEAKGLSKLHFMQGVAMWRWLNRFGRFLLIVFYGGTSLGATIMLSYVLHGLYSGAAYK